MRQLLTSRADYEVLERKMKFFTKESAVDFAEIEEALVLVKEVCRCSVAYENWIFMVKLFDRVLIV